MFCLGEGDARDEVLLISALVDDLELARIAPILRRPFLVGLEAFLAFRYGNFLDLVEGD